MIDDSMRSLPESAWTSCPRCGERVINSHSGWARHDPWCPGRLKAIDEHADLVRRHAFERSGQLAKPWDEITEDERARWRRTIGDAPLRNRTVRP